MSWHRWLRRHLMSRPARTFVSVFAVVIGVGVFVGVSLGTRAVIAEIESTSFQPADGPVALGPIGVGSSANENDAFGSDSIEFFEQIESGLAPLAATSLLVSAFIIYLTMSRTVGDRWVTFGTMRAIGASRRSVVGTVLAESVIIGVLGTAGGLALGHLIGPGVGEGLATGFGLPVGSTGASLTSVQLAAAVVGGVAVPPLAAGIPALRAASVEPAMAMSQQRDDASVSWRRGALGLLAFVGGGAWAFVADTDDKATGVLLAMIGILAGVPLVVAPLAGLVRRSVLRRRPGVADIAAAQVVRRRGRMATTAGLVAGTLALVALVHTMAASQRPAFVDAVETTFGSDAELHVAAGSPVVIGDLTAIPGVSAATPIWRGRVDVVAPQATVENLTIIDPDTYFSVAGFVWTRGTDGAAATATLRDGGAALVSTNVADAAGVQDGDPITLVTHEGPVDLVVAGTYYGFAFGTTDAVVVSVADGERLFGAAGVELALVDLDDDARSAALVDHEVLAPPDANTPRGLVSADTGGQFAASFYPTAGLREDIISQFDGIWGLIQVLTVVVAVLGLLGLANTLAMEVLDRRHEFGVLRTLGLQRREVWRLVMVEGALFAGAAAVCAVVTGTLLGWSLANAGEGGIDELSVQLRFPADAAIGLVIGSILIGGLVSAIPGRTAANVSPTELLRGED